MEPSEVYVWEMETDNGTVIKQVDDDGVEHRRDEVDPHVVVRFTLKPRQKGSPLPSHSAIVDHEKQERYVRSFGRGFIKDLGLAGYGLKEYVNCVETSFYRLWVFSNGQCLTTNPGFEVYI